jgi:transposase
MEEVYTISTKQLQRYHKLKLVLDGTITLLQASVAMKVSYRHAKRLKKAFSSGGTRALLHGNRGRSPANKIDDEMRCKIIALSEQVYSDLNDTHFTEMLWEREGTEVSRQSVRAIRRAEGIRPKRKRRVRKHHSRRPRKLAEGLMMLWDGSPHRWFGKERAPCCLIAAMDDATGKVLALFFTEFECSAGYFELLKRVVRDYGIPGCVYQDRHSALKRNDAFWSIEEQLAGRQDPTQVGAALEALGIEQIYAQTPQAKGRVEKLFETLQDRLVPMLAIEGITDIASGNGYLESSFMEYFNGKFAVIPEQAKSAWRKAPRDLDLPRIIAFRYEASVANDNAIRLGGITIDVPPGPAKRSYAGIRAEVRQLLDGSWRVYHQNKLIATAPASEVIEPIRAKHRRKGVRAAVDAQWIYWASAPQTTGAPPTIHEPDGSAPAHTAAGKIRSAGPSRAIGATRIA